LIDFDQHSFNPYNNNYHLLSFLTLLSPQLTCITNRHHCLYFVIKTIIILEVFERGFYSIFLLKFEKKLFQINFFIFFDRFDMLMTKIIYL